MHNFVKLTLKGLSKSSLLSLALLKSNWTVIRQLIYGKVQSASRLTMLKCSPPLQPFRLNSSSTQSITSIYSINNFLEVEKYDNESTHLVSFDVKFSCIGYFLMSSSTPGLDLKDKKLHDVMLGTNSLIKCLIIKLDEKMCRQVSMMSWLNMYNLLKRPVDRCRLQIYMSMHLGGCWPHA